MSIDSVGDSSSATNEVARHQRKLQEERAAQIKASDERQQRELEHLTASRQQQLENVYETQSHEIDARRREAGDQVEIAKSDAAARTRTFENETQKLTEEAKRQFQAKATQLQRAASEMEGQRTMLIKQHDNALQRIRENAEHSEEVALHQGMLESARAHINQTRNINEINERGEIEAARIKDDVQDQKRMITDEGARNLRALKENYDDYSNQIDKQVAFTKREGQEQVAHQNENLKMQQTRMEIEASDRNERLQRQTGQALNRMHFEGNRKLAETNNAYSRQVADVEKNARNKIREESNREAFTMASLQTEAEAQEGIARAAYANQKAAIAGNRDKSISESIKMNEALQKQLRTDYDMRSKVYGQETERKLKDQFAADETEIKFHRDEGRKAVNAQIASTAETVGGRAGKASDPFYRVNIMAPQVQDGELETIVRMAVPEHEQESVRISHQIDSLTVSGTRRFQERVKLEGGREATTNSYQSYSENFPVRGKLEMNNMSRTYGDGILTFRIPKS